jgi:hypothetical protein
MDVDISEIKRRFEGVEIDAEKILKRRAILIGMGYSDFTWYLAHSRSAHKEFKNSKWQGSGWIKYSCTAKNLHLLSDEEFQLELDALPKKERIAKGEHKKWLVEKQREFKQKLDAEKNEGRYQVEDRLNLQSAISSVEEIVNKASFKSVKFKSPFIKLLEELNNLKSL